jgi:hypothetical protein
MRKERKKDEIAFQTSIFKNQTCKFPIDKRQSLELTSKQAIEMNESSSQVKY